jgi:acyl-coenzyme A synthetase/AMP-(fatty) acid ligase
VDEAALKSHCAQKLAGYKQPKKYVFLDALPRTRNGKIARRLL